MKANMFYCASQASTATANEERTITARAIDRHNPIIKDGRRSFTAPCSSGDDYVAPYRQLSKITRIPSSSSGGGKSVQVDKGRRSNAGSLLKLVSSDVSLARKSFGCIATPKTPPGSTRYLLGSDPVSLAGSTGQDTVVTEEGEASGLKRGSSGAVEEKKKSSGSGSGSGSDQVVVLRVSLHCHCRGCEGKVKKHLSRMQGVTSFNIDFASKKVTVTGDITPFEVLGCLSKVKNAQFWTPPQSSLSTANPGN